MPMFDADALRAMMGELDEAQQAKVNELIDLRREYLANQAKLWQRRMQLLANPTPAGNEELENYAELLDQHKTRITELLAELKNEVFDFSKVKSLLPMFGLGVLQGVNVPLLVGLTGLDLTDVVRGINKLQSSLFGGGPKKNGENSQE